MVFQSFGTAEGGRLQDVKDMAKAAGQSFPGFTPPQGETQEQVRSSEEGAIVSVMNTDFTNTFHNV